MIVTTLFLMYEKPVRPGVYKLARIDEWPLFVWSYWDGIWNIPAESPEAAMFWKRSLPSEAAYDPRRVIGWRGLAEPV